MRDFRKHAFIEQSKRAMSANWNEGSIATPDDLVDQLVHDPSGSRRSENLTVRRYDEIPQTRLILLADLSVPGCETFASLSVLWNYSCKDCASLQH